MRAKQPRPRHTAARRATARAGHAQAFVYIDANPDLPAALGGCYCSA